MSEFDLAFEIVSGLVKRFQENEPHYKAPNYSEAAARKDFIDKFWIALGWDVNHDRETNPYEQEVKVERSVVMGGGQRRADYAFYLAPNFRDVRFFVEAKKPFVEIGTRENYFQLIRYGWNSETPIAVINDFEQFHVLDCRYKPDLDSALNRALSKYHYTDYTNHDKFSEIYWLFSREAVASGSLEKRAKELPKPRGKSEKFGLLPGGYQSIDESFLAELDDYRNSLARSFKNRNPDLDSETLTELAQRTLDRLVFLRFLEDKGIEPERIIERFGGKGTAWEDFVAASRRLDGIYNGIVYKRHDYLDRDDFQVDDKAFADICKSLSYANSPYDFNFIPIHILGSIYERFLGKVIVATDKRAKVEEKPEVRKAGGVYYTPEYIVRYIVENTVGKLIAGKTPAEIAEMRFADIACGSGSFLLGVFDLLLDYHGCYYNDNPGKAKKGDCVERDGKLFLSLGKKREILLNNIYGVDIDAQAVEVCQLSLYLKLLQDETESSARQCLLDFEHAERMKRLLPDLSKNIRCGNSLIGTDILDGQLFPREEERKLNPMNFEDAFSEVMKRGGFDAIVGNPPYIRIQTMQETNPTTVKYLSQYYESASKGNYDIYVVFVERALSLLNEKGRFGYILPHKFFNSQYGEPLREVLAKGSHVTHVVHFGDQQVFDGATTYTCLLFLAKAGSKNCQVVKIKLLDDWRNTGEADAGEIPSEAITKAVWNFSIGAGTELFEKLNRLQIKLEDITNRIFQGLKTGADKVYIVERVKNEEKRLMVYSREKETEFWLEPDLLHPLIKGGDSRRYHLSRTDRLILFPYERQTNEAVKLIPELLLKERYPLTWEYLVTNKSFLENRENGLVHGKGWYAYTRTQALDVISLPKIFTPDIASCSSFSLDETGEVFFTGGVAGGYGILVQPEWSREYVLGLLNSKLLEWFIRLTASQMRGGYFSYESRYIRNLPIPNMKSSDAVQKSRQDEMMAKVEVILEAKKQLALAKTDKDKTYYENKCAGLDRQIDRLVYDLYGLTEEEIKIVEEATK